MRIRALSMILDLALLLVSLSANPVTADAIRTLVIVLCGVAVALGMFFAVVLALGVAAQRMPPYDMTGGI
jgi:hypothetical protein